MGTGNHSAAALSNDDGLQVSRRELLSRFLMRSEAFSLYYDRLPKEKQRDLYGALSGPGYDRLLEGTGHDLPVGNVQEPVELEEFLVEHFKSFDEYVKAMDWQDRQFFGFLQQLSREQIQVLTNHTDSRSAAMMLRYMKPQQSAYALDALTPAQKYEILSMAKQLKNTSLAEIQSVEKQIRTVVQQMPNRFVGSEKGDVGFWGGVVSESEHQDELLDMLEKTHPEIYPNLKKFRFTLEDAATLPDGILERVLREVDNDELGLALAACSEDVADVLLDAVAEKRKQILLNQIDTYRHVPKEQLATAKASLTKRMREVLA
jgi:hypothetical protein